MSDIDRDIDAFDTQDPHGEIRGHSSQDQEQDIQLGSASDDVIQEPSRPRTPQQPFAVNRLCVFMGMAGLMVGLGEGAFSAISFNNVSMLRADIAITFEDIDSNIAALDQRQNTTDVSIIRLQTQTADNAEAIDAFDTARIANDVMAVRTALNDVNNQLRESTMEAAQII